jgi:PAS domain S-box-containing protein
MPGVFVMPQTRSLRDCETLRQLVQRLPAAVYVSTAAGDILDANPACLQLFGVRSLAELQRFRAGDLLADPAHRARELAILDESGSVSHYELELRRPDGQVRTVVDTCYTEADPESGETVYLGVLIDVSERKRLEARLREQSMRDPLTGCFNRRYLAELEERLRGEGATWGALVVDVDRFK